MSGIMSVQHNLSAMNANRMLGLTTTARAKSSEKLSSGYKINRAADDAAGLAISEKMRRQIRGLTQASANCQDGISLCQVADGALTETQDILQRMNELAIKAANGTLSENDRKDCQKEVKELISEIDRIAYSTTFNDSIYPLLGGKSTVSQLSSITTGTSVVSNVGTLTSTTGSAPASWAYYLRSSASQNFDYYASRLNIGGVKWEAITNSSYNMAQNSEMSRNAVDAFIAAWNDGQFDTLSGTVPLTFFDGTSTVTYNGTISAINNATPEQVAAMTDSFTIGRYGDHYLKVDAKAKYVGEVVSGTVLDTALNNMVNGGFYTSDINGNIVYVDGIEATGSAGTASVANLDFGSLTGGYLAENDITLTVGNTQYTFTTDTPSSATQIQVGENDSGSSLVSSIAAVISAGTSDMSLTTSGSTITFTENIKYMDANHYFRAYSGQALNIALSDTPPDFQQRPYNRNSKPWL